MSKTQIIYIANIRMPTEKAHGLQIMKMCEAFAEAGRETCLMVPRRFNRIKTDPWSYYGVKNNFKIIKIPCLDFILFDKIFGQAAFWLEAVSFLISAKIYLVFKNVPGTVYTRDFLTGIFFKSLILETHYLPDKLTGWHRRILSRAERIVAITKCLKEKLVNLGMPAEKISVAPDGVDLKDFEFQSGAEDKKELGLPARGRVVLYAGHLYKWKGAGTLLEAVKFLDNGIAVVFVGGTEKDVNSFKELARCGGMKNVFILGHKPHHLMPRYLKLADVLVLPNSGIQNISRCYTSPLKLFEYMASGKPIVASDLPSLREVLNEENSILVKPDDPAALARGILTAMEDDNLKTEISRKSLEDVKKYTWTNRAGLILKNMGEI